MVETTEGRYRRRISRLPLIVRPLYFAHDFLWHRIFPKIKLTQPFYYRATNGRDRHISLAEALGRLYSCGFTAVDLQESEDSSLITAKKSGQPAFDMNPTYGPIITLKRVGLHGKIIEVLKFRTMHPYSEYIQEYIFENNRLAEQGKFANDFRVTGWGRFMRRFWLDELPMLWNFARGDLKIFGVRPLSLHYFSLYPEDMQKLRVSVKPGLIPPFYADLPVGFDAIIDSERRYIMKYKEAPISTDIEYFFRALYNILFRRARSQ
jgi:lipopolysaccharide/colanic/teichoic acid biosynthesis glycosyltransferase